MKKIINPWRNHEGYNCFGCSPDNPIGLHLEFYEDGDYIVSTWHPGHNYQGWVDTMHGGILSTLIDEVCGWVVTRKLQTSGYTVQLNVKFRKAVPTTEPELTIRAKVSKQVRNLAYISAEITNSKGELCNEGEAIYFLMNEEKAKEMDPMGRAIADYWKTKKADRLRVFSPMFEEDEIPLATLFRKYEDMPEIERKALDMAKGKTLDVGAGSGCHSLVLQERASM